MKVNFKNLVLTSYSKNTHTPLLMYKRMLVDVADDRNVNTLIKVNLQKTNTLSLDVFCKSIFAGCSKMRFLSVLKCKLKYYRNIKINHLVQYNIANTKSVCKFMFY